MTDFAEKPRHYCRNARCRSKLAAPATLKQRAFCCRGCCEQFYRHRCVVCESELPPGPGNRKTCRKAKCRAEYRRFRHLYDWPESAPMGHGSPNVQRPLEKLDSMRVKSPVKTERGLASRIRGWQWHRVPGEDDDWELRNRNGGVSRGCGKNAIVIGWLARAAFPNRRSKAFPPLSSAPKKSRYAAFSAPWPERKRRPLHVGLTPSQSHKVKPHSTPVSLLDKSPDVRSVAQASGGDANNGITRGDWFRGRLSISDDSEIPEFLRRTKPGSNGIG